MKKLIMMAAAVLLMAGMMVSCQGSNNPEEPAGVKKEVKSIKSAIYGKTSAEAVKALTDMGFSEDKKVARRTSKAYKKAEQPAQNQYAYIKNFSENSIELVLFATEDDKVNLIMVGWENTSTAYKATENQERAKQLALLAAETCTPLGVFVASITNDDVMTSYMEDNTGLLSDALKQLEQAKAQLEAAYKAGMISQEEYDQIKAQLEVLNFKTQPQFLIDLAATFKDNLYAAAEYANKACINDKYGILNAVECELDENEKLGYVFYTYSEGEFDPEQIMQ